LIYIANAMAGYVSRWILALGVSRILTLIERIAHRVEAIFWVYFSHSAMPSRGVRDTYL